MKRGSGGACISHGVPWAARVHGSGVSFVPSLAAYFPQDTEIAASLAESEYRSEPRDANTLAKIGDIFADRELYSRARPFWNRMPGVQPGGEEPYLEAATVFWDYYLFNDALRLISESRMKFDNPAMFSYQAGAIYEGRRDYRSAVRAYLEGAIADDGEARQRLVRLATRPRTRDLVDRATAAAVAGNPSWAALSVRVEVLAAQQRRTELEALLGTRAATEKSSSTLSQIAEAARRYGFEPVEARVAEREVAITNDPVDKMELTLTLARLYESKKDVATAARRVDALHTQYPLILGVIRGAVDFHVRNGQSAEAIRILLDAAKRGTPEYAGKFTLEAARVVTDAGDFARARELLGPLLAADPFRAEYLAAMGDTYLRAKDDAGFREYQLATIEKLKQSVLAPAERVERITTLRRSLIPALSRLNEYRAAVEQYIEIVNRYPEDEALTKEAAAYAVAHQQAQQMVEFYRKTIAEAPCDYRWPIVLGRVQTVAEDYPAAIAAYELALKARPDRADVLEAKARLEERLLRFEDAAVSYEHLYESGLPRFAMAGESGRNARSAGANGRNGCRA